MGAKARAIAKAQQEEQSKRIESLRARVDVLKKEVFTIDEIWGLLADEKAEVKIRSLEVIVERRTASIKLEPVTSCRDCGAKDVQLHTHKNICANCVEAWDSID